jgi:hypothetical protein
MAFTRADATQPGQPVTIRTRMLRVEAGTLARATLACARGERLLGATHSVGLYLRAAPTRRQLAAVRVVVVRRRSRLLISATRERLAQGVRAEVQVLAECAR